MCLVMQITTRYKFILFSLGLIAYHLKSYVHNATLNYSSVTPSWMWRSVDAQESDVGATEVGGPYGKSVVTSHPALPPLFIQDPQFQNAQIQEEISLTVGMHIPEEVLGIKEICESEKDVGMQD